MTREEKKAYNKAYYQANKEKRKAYYQNNKDKSKIFYQINKDKIKAYTKTDVNSLGQTKQCIRVKSQSYHSKYGQKLPNYQIHHCFTYDDPTKFIYCSKETHLKIHQFLRDNNIDADSNHFEQIKHLLDDTVIIYGVNNVQD